MLIKKNQMKTKNTLVILTLLFSTLNLAQVGIGTSSVSTDVILEVAPTNTAILLPKVDNVNDIASPERAMLVYDETNEGVRGYFSPEGTVATLKWGNLFLNEDIVLLKKMTNTLTSYTRDAEDVHTWTELTGLRTSVTVGHPNTLITAQFSAGMYFQQNCFRGSVAIQIKNPSGTVVAILNDKNGDGVLNSSSTHIDGVLFNFGGTTSRYSEFPFDTAIRYAVPAKGTYTIEVLQSPTKGTVCGTLGYFNAPTLTVNYY